MQLDSLLDLIVGVSDANALMPRGFSILSDCLEHGVKHVSLNKYLSGRGAYDPETETIQLDPTLDRAKLAREINQRYHVDIQENEVFLWAFFHELHHHINRRRLLRNPHRNAQLYDTFENREQEDDAQRYAKRRFIEWRGTRR